MQISAQKCICRESGFIQFEFGVLRESEYLFSILRHCAIRKRNESQGLDTIGLRLALSPVAFPRQRAFILLSGRLKKVQKSFSTTTRRKKEENWPKSKLIAVLFVVFKENINEKKNR